MYESGAKLVGIRYRLCTISGDAEYVVSEYVTFSSMAPKVSARIDATDREHWCTGTTEELIHGYDGVDR